MTRSAATSVQNNFSKGFVTEASGLNFPENTCTEALDVIFNIDGTVETRAGLDFEPNYTTKVIDRTDSSINHFVWRDVAGNGELTLLVLQVGSTLHFYEANTTSPVSNFPLPTTVDLTTFSPAGAPTPALHECQFAAGRGYLFVSHPHLETFYVSYDADTVTATATQIDITIRDFEGVDDGLAVAERQTISLASTSDAHKYNLYNQGWNTTNLTTWDTNLTTIPSNADVMWAFKNASNDFDTALADKVYRGNSPAPNGHFILNLYNQDRTTASGVAVTGLNMGYERCPTAAFFQGRVFYAGVNYTSYGSRLFFSQIIEKSAQFGACYQANDPTSEDASDLLPSDGGVIHIQEAGNIIKLFSSPTGLLVFATNGVWLISGSTGLGFTATDSTVSRVSSIHTLAHTSFVDAGGMPIWWTLDGIYTVQGGQAGASVQSLTVSTIQSFYDDIAPSSKRHARGSYNPIDGVVMWCYSSTDAGTIEELYAPDRILLFNTRTAAFSVWTTNNTNVKIHGVFVLEQLGGVVDEETIVDEAGETVVDDAGDTIIYFNISDGVVTPRVKFIVSYFASGAYHFTIAEERDETRWVDWYSYDSVGLAYNASFTTGYKLHGQGINKFQPMYVQLYSKNDVPTKYTFQSRWDYAITSDTGRWGTVQHVQHTDLNYGFASRRLRVRGQGLTLQYKVSQVAGYPFSLAGWVAMETGNTTP